MDGNAFLSAVEAIYAAAPEPSLWPQALQAIADCFGDVGAMLIWHRDDGSFGTIVSPSLAEAQKDYDEGGWSLHDLRVRRIAERGCWLSGGPFTDRHVCSEEEIRAEPIYTQYCARHGLGWFGAIGVSPDSHVSVGLNIQRDATTKPPFSDSELEVIERIGRHVEKSLRLNVQLLDADLARAGLGEALARAGIGIFALDSLGRVLFSNPVADRLRADGVDIVQDSLRSGSGSASTAIQAAIARTLRGEPADLIGDLKPILVKRTSSDRPLAIYLLPVRPGDQPTQQFLSHTRAILLMINSSPDAPADPALVRDVLGLTLGEARVAALVGAGLAPRDAAQKLGISEETARTALKRVFSKVRVSRQSELAALLTKLILR